MKISSGICGDYAIVDLRRSWNGGMERLARKHPVLQPVAQEVPLEVPCDQHELRAPVGIRPGSQPHPVKLLLNAVNHDGHRLSDDIEHAFHTQQFFRMPAYQ